MKKICENLLAICGNPALLLALLWFILAPAPTQAATINSSNSASYKQGQGINRGLVGWWTFDGADMAGVTAYDKSVNGNNGTLNGGVRRVQGKLGQGMNFDGSGWVASGGSTVSASSSLFAWIKPSFLGQCPGSSPNTCLIAKISSDFFLEVNTGLITFYGYHLSPGGWIAAGDAGIVINKWMFIGFTYDQTTLRFYLNGVQIGSSNQSGTVGSGGNITIGGDNDLRMFKGVIDDVRSYNRALSAQEVRQLYQMGATSKISETPQKQSQFQGKGINSGLVGWWTMDGADVTATQALDKSGQANHGTKSGGVKIIQGKIGQGMSFNGLNSEIDVANIPVSIVTTSTISFWVKPRSLPEGTHLLTSYGGADYPTGNLIAQNGAGLYFYWLSGGSSLSAGSLSVNKWSHIVVTSGSGNIIAYQDGVIIGSAAIGIGIPTSHTFYIGGRDSGSWNFDGAMDDVRVYSRALSAAEVKQLYQMGATSKISETPQKQSQFQGKGINSGLVGWWTMDGADTTPTTVLDKSGQNNTGTRNGGVTKAIGKLGQAMKFNGSASYISATFIPSVTYNGTYSFSVWLKPTDVTAARCIFQNSSAGSDRNGMSIEIGTVRFGYFDGAWHGASGAISVNKWTHVVGINNGTALSIYINGVKGTGTDAPYVSIDSILWLGKYDYYSSSPGSFYNGLMDDVRIYSRALSAAEVQQLYQMGK